MQRFYTEEKLTDELIIRDADMHHQISRVLRMQKGDACIFFAGNFVDEVYEIVDISKSQIILKRVDSIQKSRDTSTRVVLCQSLPNKIEKLEYIIQKCVEVGVDEFVFFSSERSQPLALLEKKKPRLLDIAKEAVEQCGWDTLPVITFAKNIPEINLPGFVTDTKEAPAFANFVGSTLRECAIFIGPEGGWSDVERAYFREKNITSISLGSRVLRTETAGVCAAFLAKNIQK